MATITAEMVRELREKTGVGMMDCKKALTDADGDMTKAVEGLRKAGMAKAEKKATRTAKEGRVVVSMDKNVVALVEVLCETDFVATNEKFQAYEKALAQRVATSYSVDGDLSAQVVAAEKGALADLINVLGENIQVRRVIRWQTDGAFACYMHMGGKIGVLIDAAGETDPKLLSDACMHIAAFSPRFVGPADVPAEVLAKEKEIAAAQVGDKPANMIEKIVTGKISKWYNESCLMLQPWIRDDKKSLTKVAPNLKVKRFVRWQVGESV
ncbi:MAG: translation elongation factor Ts [Lentisphaerae bacterium RIFOXYB12_FULL_65_16]|nr:MAG: translation elongation factor Ts [Lentisphaerae bacterium RIFOXYA12_64_32]OGV88129.1 MAG: translation elongation factor Ts [Lentisphaerae bacterium RIFOXYB12_FULL_65_16]